MERLDWACGERWWLDRFPEANVSQLPMACLDHIAILLSLKLWKKWSHSKKARFRIEATCLSKDTKAALEQGWLDERSAEHSGICVAKSECMDLP
ncbi:UNVERIFIED_CONTAM: hypothetical protein Slati_2921600 [Sesamum latifolium]|uniref:Uncharacterized protein n=1 Tax=Sesamum latifolium TaxID=2727402 RepID=A0AAW2VE10_9LAMI